MKIDLLNPDSYVNGHPYDQLLYLQEAEPVSWQEEEGDGPGYWALTRYADMKAVQAKPDVFSSSPTDAVPDGTALGDGVNTFHLIMTDPPHHTLHRRHIGHELLPKSVAELHDDIQQVATEIVDKIVETGECDLVTDVAGPLAAHVTADLMGLPRPDMVEMYHLADRIVNASDLTSGDGLEAATELDTYTRLVWADRRANPREDLVTRHAHSEVDGRPVQYEQFALDFLLVFSAAGDTTRNALGGGLNALFDHPDQLQRFVSDEAITTAAVDEMLRWVTPLSYQRRTAQQDTVVGGQEVSKGAKVASFYAAGNRDPRAFDKPEVFDISRRPNNHLSFGFGPHYCLGAHLARLEMSVMLRELFNRLPDLHPTAPPSWTRAGFRPHPIIVGPVSLKASFSPSSKVLV